MHIVNIKIQSLKFFSVLTQRFQFFQTEKITQVRFESQLELTFKIVHLL